MSMYMKFSLYILLECTLFLYSFTLFNMKILLQKPIPKVKLKIDSDIVLYVMFILVEFIR